MREPRIPEGDAAEALAAVGDKVRAARLAKGMTQQQLAALVGVNVSTIGRIERAERYLRRSTLRDIVNSLVPPVDRDAVYGEWAALAGPGLVDESAYEFRVRSRRERRQAKGRRDTVREMQEALAELQAGISTASPHQQSRLLEVQNRIQRQLADLAEEHDLEPSRAQGQQLGSGHSGRSPRVCSGRDPADVHQPWQRTNGISPREELHQIREYFAENWERERANLGPIASAELEAYFERLHRFVETGIDGRA